MKIALDPEKVRLSEEFMLRAMKVSGRSCGDCSMCCKLLDIAETDSPGGSWCKHAKPGCGGCVIHDSRPDECRAFACLWLVDTRLNDYWKPSRSKMVVQPFTHTSGEIPWTQIQVHVDPAYPRAWDREPYRGDLMAMAKHFLQEKGIATAIKINERVTHMVLPDRIEAVSTGAMTILPEPMKGGGTYYRLIQHANNDDAVRFKRMLDSAKEGIEEIRTKDPALYNQLVAEVEEVFE